MREADVLDTQFNERLRSGICLSIEITDFGLVLGVGTRLARMVPGQQCISYVAHGKERERLFALLSVAQRRPIATNKLHRVAAASLDDWERGEKALAHIRLAQVNLPYIDDIDDAYRLFLAEMLLDDGMTPRALMKALGLDASLLDLIKYDPDQPRVPAGNGRDSGRWGFGEGIMQDFIRTAQKQKAVADDRGAGLKWYFAEQSAADAVRERFEKEDLESIVISHMPPKKRK